MTFAELLAQSWDSLLGGLGLTVRAALISLVFACILGLVFGLFNISKSKVFKFFATIYIDAIRGTPLIVQAFFLYFGIGQAFGIRFDPFVAAVITLSLNAGAYIAEIVRGGILSISHGQMEAARSLGLNYMQSMQKVILPQALRNMLPALMNQFIITLKDTSILSAIGLSELTQSGKIIIARNFESFKTWTIVAIMYLIVITLLSKLSKYVEKRMRNDKSKSI